MPNQFLACGVDLPGLELVGYNGQGYRAQPRNALPGHRRWRTRTVDVRSIGNLVVPRRRQQELPEFVFACGNEQLDSGPIELVADSAVVVGPTTYRIACRSQSVGMKACGNPCASSRLQTPSSERRIERAKDSSTLGSCGREIQRGGRAGRPQNALWIVGRYFGGRNVPEAGPLLVVHLMVSHACQRLPFWNLHLEQELDLPPRLVEQIRSAVALLGNAQLAVGKRTEAGSAEISHSLVQRHQRVNGNPTVYHVFPEVTCIVPASAYVEGVIAPCVLGTRDVAIAQVPGRTHPLLLTGIGQLDRDSAASVIEIPNCVIF